MSAAIRDDLLGSWRLVGFRNLDLDTGSATQPFGDEPQGLLFYTPEGNMSAQLMRPSRASFKNGDWLPATSDEYVEAATGYISYAGTFELDAEKQIVQHHVKVALIPNLVGTVMQRLLTLNGTRLTLRTYEFKSAEAARTVSELIWIKIEGA